MSALALDLSTMLGFAILRADGRIESGRVDLHPKAKEGPGVRWTRFNAWLVDTKNVHDVDRIAYEEIVGQMPGQVLASQIYGGFVAILQRFAEHHRIPCHGINVSTVKKRWTGSGNANKAAMIARCKALGFKPVDDNEADAIALLHVQLDRCPPLPLEAQVKKRPLRKDPDNKSKPLQFDPF